MHPNQSEPLEVQQLGNQGAPCASSAPMSEPPQGHKIPNPIRRRCLVSQYVDAAVVCTNLVKDLLRAIPLVQYLLDQVLAFLQPKANGSLVCLSPRVALHLHPHVPCILAQMSVTWNCR